MEVFRRDLVTYWSWDAVDKVSAGIDCAGLGNGRVTVDVEPWCDECAGPLAALRALACMPLELAFSIGFPIVP